MKPTRGPVDVRIEYHGSLYLLRPLSHAAKLWLIDHVGTPVDEVQWFGGAVVVEPRYISDILEGLRADGLVAQ
jgi:hypothetical protein